MNIYGPVTGGNLCATSFSTTERLASLTSTSFTTVVGGESYRISVFGRTVQVDNLSTPACTASGTCISGPCASDGGSGSGSGSDSSKKRNIIILVLIIGGALLLLALAGVGSFFAIRAYRRRHQSGAGGAYNEPRSYQLM